MTRELKGILMMSRPWRPQDLLDDLQLLIDEEPDRYLNDRRTTLCMARDFLKEHFAMDDSLEKKTSDEKASDRKQATSGWVSVEERLPEESTEVLSFFCVRKIDGTWERYTATAIRLRDAKWLVSDYQNGIEAYSWGTDIEDCCFRVTHWMPLPEPPEVEV